MRVLRILLAAVVICAPLPAAAQWVPQRGSTGLTEHDVALLSASVESLNATKDVRAGAHDRWSNPRSHSHGVNTITRVFREHGTTCHTVRHEIVVKGHMPARVYNLTWCRAPDGSWKIKS